MRPVMHGDVVAAARVLYVQPEEARAEVVARLLEETRWADAYRKRQGRAHPLWGDGSLMVAALMRRPPDEPSLSDSDYCACLSTVLDAVIAARG